MAAMSDANNNVMHKNHTEIQKGHVIHSLCPFPLYPDLPISHSGVIPKKNQPGKWHLISDFQVMQH